MLTPEQLEEAKQLYFLGYPTSQVSAMLGVKVSKQRGFIDAGQIISKLCNDKGWRQTEIPIGYEDE